MYALNLGNSGRILSATYPEYAPADAVLVDELPDGNIADYLYAAGTYVYDPLPEPSTLPVATRNITAGEYVTIDGVMYKTTMNIPNGGAVITGQNAEETTVEAQLYELTQKGA